MENEKKSNLAKGTVRRNFRGIAKVKGLQNNRTFSSDEGFTQQIQQRLPNGKLKTIFTIHSGQDEQGNLRTTIYKGELKEEVTRFEGSVYVTPAQNVGVDTDKI